MYTSVVSTIRLFPCKHQFLKQLFSHFSHISVTHAKRMLSCLFLLLNTNHSKYLQSIYLGATQINRIIKGNKFGIHLYLCILNAIFTEWIFNSFCHKITHWKHPPLGKLVEYEKKINLLICSLNSPPIESLVTCYSFHRNYP